MLKNVVNLNKFRKQQAKLEKAQKADTNRRLHGRTAAAREREFLQKKTLETQVENARLEPPADDEDGNA